MGLKVSKLVERLKAKGLDVTEELAVVMVTETFGWAEDEIVESVSKKDDMLLIVFPAVKKAVLALTDKIDGQDDAGR